MIEIEDMIEMYQSNKSIEEMFNALGYEKKVDGNICVQYKRIDEDGDCYIIELDLDCDTIGKYLITNNGWEIVKFDIEEIPVVFALIQNEY